MTVVVQTVVSHVIQQGLLQHCRKNDIRGLERWLCRTYAVARSNDQVDAKHAVLLEQARQFLAQEQDDEALARVALESSRKARAFAALLGEADSAAVKQMQLDDISPPRQTKMQEPALFDSHHDDPVSDDCSQEEIATPPIFISIQTLP